MVTEAWLERRGNAAARHLRTRYPDLTVTHAPAVDLRTAVVTYLDGPTRFEIERALRDQYTVRHLSAARLTLRRRLTLASVIEVTLTARFPPQTLQAVAKLTAHRTLPAPTARSQILADLYTGGQPLPWGQLESRYRDLCAFLTDDLVAAATATTLPVR